MRPDPIEPLIRCTCRVCGRDYAYGGPEKKGYDKELCGPMCDGREMGEAKMKGQRDLLLEACKMAEHRYRSMWFDIQGPKPVSNVRGEWEALKQAIAATEDKEPTE